MIIGINNFKELKDIPNSGYEMIKIEFLFHSNKIEGSTFTKENLEVYLKENIVDGSHKIDDIYETINSIKLFDFVIDTLDEPLSKRLILEFHRMLKDNTLDYERGFAGFWKKIPNFITGTSLKLAQPYEVDGLMDSIIMKWNASDKSFENIVEFHVNFEKNHPFQDGNGRIGRFIILKQCIENNIDLIAIDEMFNKQYKEALNKAQVQGDYSDIQKVFSLCQQLLSQKLSMLEDTITLYLDTRKSLRM